MHRLHLLGGTSLLPVTLYIVVATSLVHRMRKVTPLTGDLRDDVEKQHLQDGLKVLYQYAPQTVLETFKWIVQVDEANSGLMLISRIEFLWDGPIANMLLTECVPYKGLSLNNRVALVHNIGTRSFELIEQHLLNWFEHRSHEPESWAFAKVAAMLLLVHAPDQYWDKLFASFKTNLKFGRGVVNSLTAQYLYSLRPIHQLDDAQTGNYLNWLYEAFYSIEQAQTSTGIMTEANNAMRYFWNGLYALAERGTLEARNQTLQLAASLDSDLSRYVAVANATYLDHSWQPYPPNALLMLLQHRDNRAIQNAGQLLDVIVEKLNLLSQLLQEGNKGHPAAIDVWNEYKITGKDSKRVKHYTPLDENRLSDYLWRFLRRELEGTGIIINREVEVKRGNNVDILIQANPPKSNDASDEIIQIVIEVKGCWHRDLKTAMRSQLYDRYLVQSGIKHGLYLVGQYFCEKWTQTHDETNWSRSKRIDWDSLTKQLNDEAHSLSVGGYDVRFLALDVRLS